MNKLRISRKTAYFAHALAILFFISISSFAQTDTSLNKKTTDTTQVKKHSPGRATLYSTIIPGLGQAYNKKYWKLPIVYAGIGGCAYMAGFHQSRYNAFRDAWNELNSTNPSGSIEFDGYTYTLEGLSTGKTYYRRNRDLFVIFTAGVYLLNIVDANVDAHLYDFDISDDLSLRIQPALIPMANYPFTGTGFSFKFSLK
ncbi:MAG: hypothetical protein CVU05_01400 [Bacteroidetes bacterium HGW-Bacteroidetes-21]|nr:MAG: hypothetical protein CVU05_01400 [Bacteroidetes bacterium HGW-Bacteroidetes-21]